MNSQDKNKTTDVGMRAAADKVPEITGLYNTERPLVEGGTLYIMGETTTEASPGHPFERV